MERHQQLMVVFKEHKLEVIDQLIRTIHQITRWSLTELEKRGESYDDIYYKNKQAEQKSFRMLNYYSDRNKNEPDEEEEQNQYTRTINMLNSKFEQVSKFILLSFRMFYHFESYTNEECIARFDQYEDLEDLLRKVLLETDNFYIRDQFMENLCEMLCNQQNNELKQFIEFKKKVLNILIFKISKDLQISPTRSYKYFDCLVKLLHSTKNRILIDMGIDFEHVLEMNIDVIVNKESIEKSTSDYDTILCGCVKVVKVILQQFPEYKESYGQKLLGFLLKDCLFEVPSTNVSRKKVRPPKCKNNVTRNEVFRLINVFARDCLENLDVVLSYIKGLQDNSSWRSRKQQDWCISPHHDEKSITGYVGIKNLGCICYMISLFQQLYMIPSFRESILAIDDPKKEE